MTKAGKLLEIFAGFGVDSDSKSEPTSQGSAGHVRSLSRYGKLSFGASKPVDHTMVDDFIKARETKRNPFKALPRIE